MIVVNFATRNFKSGQNRLRNSLSNYHHLMYDNYSQIGSPTHQESPYEFKCHALKIVINIDPIVLWADASMYRVGDLSKIENIIKEDGHFFEEAGHYVGRWCNEHTRNYFNLTVQEAVQGEGGLTMFSAGLLGLNRNNERAMKFLDEWTASAKAGCFKGDWADHRHDMTCASIIAQRMGMKYQTGASHLCYIGPGYSQPNREAVFHCQGYL